MKSVARSLVAPVALLVLAVPSHVRADEARAFFEGKRMTYIVASAPGGGYDTYTRLIARHLPKHLPVSDVIVRNLPGGGHILGANELYVAKPDGLTIGCFNTGLVYTQILGRLGVKFDLRRMSWIGKAGGEARGLVVSKQSGYESIEQVMNAKRPLLTGSSGVGTSGYNDLALLASQLGIDAKYVFGLHTREAQLAMMRGDIHAAFGSYSSYRDFVTEGHGKYVVQIAAAEDSIAGVPDARDLVKTDIGRHVVELIRAQAALLRVTAAPPGVPAERLEMLRDAYMATLNDPELLAEAAKLQVPISPMRGDELARRIDSQLEPSAELVELLASVMNVEVETMTATVRLEAVENEGRVVRFVVGGTPIAAAISGSRTRVTLDGQPADRSALRVSMPCEITYRTDAEHEAQVLSCTSP
jgi:tripartite-type tricarboxylate transporter receptor subunit TctC